MSVSISLDVAAPYPGLRPFLREESVIFFGRDQQIDDVLARLKTHQFLGVVGASGCGKSSLVRAGMLPALKSGLMGKVGSTWFAADMKPGDSPLTNLAKALIKSGVFGQRWPDTPEGIALLTASLRRSDVSLVNLIRQIELPPFTNLLVLADQFEEIFRFQQQDPDEALAFVKLLLEAGRDRTAPIYVVLTMRTDFFDKCALFFGLPEALNDGLYLCPRLTRDQLAMAIEGPASVFDGEVEPALVTQIINDAGANSDQLPLVQHVLARMWQCFNDVSNGENSERSRVLRLEDYYNVGGLWGRSPQNEITNSNGASTQNALAQHADEAYFELRDSNHASAERGSEHSPSRKQLIAQRLFRSLAVRGVSGEYVRRPVTVAHVATVGRFSTDDVIGVVEAFRRSDRNFLTVAGPEPETVIDITHEALIRQWHRFSGRTAPTGEQTAAKSWLEEEEECRRHYRRLAEAAESEPIAGLLMNPELQYRSNWWTKFEPPEIWADACVPNSFERTQRFLQESLKQASKDFSEQEELSITVAKVPSESTIRAATSQPNTVFRPVLTLQTVWFGNDGDGDQAEARRLGGDLYELVTRPVEDRLAFGAGIPVLSGVAAQAVDLEAAEVVVLIVVLGTATFHTQCDDVLKRLEEWHTKLGAGHVLPVPTASVWRGVEDRLPGKQLLTELYGAGDRRRKTLDEIVLAVTRLFEDDSKKAQLFVSHSKADLAETGSAAKEIHDFVVTDTTGRAFFDAMALHAGKSLSKQLDQAVSKGVFLAVRGDAYSSRVWCQRELLTAKLHTLPTLMVEVLQKGEQRSSPYGGNGPSVVWAGDPAAVVSRAMVEWLRAAHFRREAERVAKMAGLPEDVVVLNRPPELLDLAQGPLQTQAAQLVMHPDPELSVIERNVLKAARPRMQVVTPTTVFRRLLTRGTKKTNGTAAPETRTEGATSVDTPLDGWQVAMSLSDSPDMNGPEGYTAQHVDDATVYLARSLISAGAAIAYGGDFRKNGFTPLLAELIQAYKQTADSSAQDLHSYLGAPLKLEDAPDLPLKIHHLVRSPDVRGDALMPTPSDTERHPDALYYSDMRRVMAKHTAARIVLGGAATPRTEKEKGYGGRYPGIVEEAWRTLQANKPLYVIGGFGGAAALVADLLEGKTIPERLQDKTWWDSELFRTNAETIDADPYRKKMDLPQRMEGLAEAVRELGLPHLKTDEAAVAWNGLAVEENRALFRSRDPVIIASLVLKGLLVVARKHGEGKLEIELVHGNVTSASNLDAIAIAVFDDVPLGGAGAALDQAIGGRASVERAGGRTLVSLDAADIDADWLYLASLRSLGDVEDLEQRIEQAALETAEQARRHGFRRLGVVAFGGTVLSETETVVKAMLRGFESLAGYTTLVWFEANESRFKELHDQLQQRSKDMLNLTTLRIATNLTAPPARIEELILQVSLDQQQLKVTALPPAGRAVASTQMLSLTDKDLEVLSVGSGYENRETPDPKTLATRGAKLAKLLFGKNAEAILNRCRDAKIIVVHDVASSRLPFELLTTKGIASPPAVHAGLSRRLAVPGVSIDHLFAQPPKAGKLKVLMVVNPLGDLEGAEQEAQAVQALLQQLKDRVEPPKVLTRKQATRKAVLTALKGADVLHYCGHAFYNGPGTDQSGLVLADGSLTIDDLKDVGDVPRIAFMNACEAARVRGAPANNAAAFAEVFLRSGVEAYLGTFWRVGDAAASTFAQEVYTRLAQGQTLEASIKAGRTKLHEMPNKDWANYILYGDGRFQLVAG